MSASKPVSSAPKGTSSLVSAQPSAVSSPTSASAASPSNPELLVATPAPKKVSKCTCGLPFCVCEPDPEVAAVKEEKPKAAPAPKPQPKAASAAAASSSFSGFSGFGSPPSSQSFSLSGNLNENCRDAVKAKSEEGVRQLLAAKANAQYADRQGMTLLHLAAMFNETGIVNLLIDNGANIHAVNPATKETPLDVAPPALASKMKEMFASRG
jgi:ankyrin repeat protein